MIEDGERVSGREKERERERETEREKETEERNSDRLTRTHITAPDQCVYILVGLQMAITNTHTNGALMQSTQVIFRRHY